MKTSSSAPNVWPGYVGATAALAITLLLLIGLLGANLFVLGGHTGEVMERAAVIVDGLRPRQEPSAVTSSLAGGDRRIGLDSRGGAPGASVLEAQLRGATASVSGAGPDADADADAGAVADAGAGMGRRPAARAGEASTPAWRIALSFDSQAYQLDEATQSALRVAVADLGERPLTVDATTDARTPGSARAAFVRVMAVRNALMAAGIAGDRIRPRVLPAAAAARDVPGRVVVVSLASFATDKETDHAR
ncbi:MAG: hypothetical protein J7598_17800 [Mitsuaria chitosanitabida]|uniref:hypothetical protein n=1 Tax=Roseateles chitosanitabidus TaxID=65048 RepID=UPI001B146D8E|nr:hypothetical protein [Roseateles chitosanitabidus]MBO9688463.1 hypothetical protein [Roseateles chitosanitabidus]